MSHLSDTEAIVNRIRRTCQERGWFGADEWLDPDFAKRPDFAQHFAPPATQEAVQLAEDATGFALPPLLRTLYLSLANGEFGPGYGILSIEELVREYREMHDAMYNRDRWKMPPQLLPLCYWGCTLYSLIDVQNETIMFIDLDGLDEGNETFVLEAPSLTIWLDRWLDGTGFGALLQEEDFEPADDPDTSVPPYLLEYRRLCEEDD